MTNPNIPDVRDVECPLCNHKSLSVTCKRDAYGNWSVEKYTCNNCHVEFDRLDIAELHKDIRDIQQRKIVNKCPVGEPSQVCHKGETKCKYKQLHLQIQKLTQENQQLKEWQQANQPTGICESCTSMAVLEADELRQKAQDLEKQLTKVVYEVTDGRLSNTNYTLGGIRQAFTDAVEHRIEEIVESYQDEIDTLFKDIENLQNKCHNLAEFNYHLQEITREKITCQECYEEGIKVGEQRIKILETNKLTQIKSLIDEFLADDRNDKLESLNATEMLVFLKDIKRVTLRKVYNIAKGENQ